MSIFGYNDLKAVQDELEKHDYVLRAEMIQRPGFLVLQVLVSRDFVASYLSQIGESIQQHFTGKLVLTAEPGKYKIDIMDRPAQVLVVQM